MTTYTVIAYRPDGIDTCRGNVMDRSSSELDVRCFQDLDGAVKFWAEKQYDSTVSERHFCSWELSLLVDGMDDNLWSELNDDSLDVLRPDPPWWKINDLSKPHVDALRLTAVEKARKAEEARKAKSEEALRQAAAKKELDDQAEFQRLSVKFGANSVSLDSKVPDATTP
jgi:hypothetical protein